MHPTNKDMPAYSSGLVHALQKMFYGPKPPPLSEMGGFPRACNVPIEVQPFT